MLLVATLVVGGALRLWYALSDFGILHPDEVYQSLEQAHRLVFGYGFMAWEFGAGARNRTFPALIAALMKLADLVQPDSPRFSIGVIRATLVGVSLATAASTYLLARTQGARRLPAACAATAVSLAAVVVLYAPRGFSEVISSLPVVLGFALALPKDASRRRLWLGASLLGFATLLRLQNGLFCVGLLVALLAPGS